MAKTSKKLKTVIFDSIGDFLADAAAKSHPDSHKVGNKRFSGTETFEEAIDLATNGWQDGRERLEELRASLDRFVSGAVAAKSKTLHHDVTGEFLDVGRFLSGEPECFGEFREAEGGTARSKVVKIVANVSAIGSVDTPSIFSAGAAIFAAVDILESLGTRVELWLGSGSENWNGGRLQVLVKIKDAGQPSEPDRIAFFLAHNATLRRLFFSVEAQRGFAASNSRTTPLELEAGTIVTPEVQHYDNTQERRIARVVEVCRTVGVEFSEEELAAITAG